MKYLDGDGQKLEQEGRNWRGDVPAGDRVEAEREGTMSASDGYRGRRCRYGLTAQVESGHYRRRLSGQEQPDITDVDNFLAKLRDLPSTGSLASRASH
jgi:hypothetical protein